MCDTTIEKIWHHPPRTYLEKQCVYQSLVSSGSREKGKSEAGGDSVFSPPDGRGRSAPGLSSERGFIDQ